MDSKKPAFVSIIVPVYKDWHKAEKCIEALSLQTYPASCYEIIIVDNNEADATDHHLHHNCTIIREPRPGSYAARNAGLDIAQGDIVAFTDADCLPDEQWIENAIKCLTRYKVDRVAGHVEIAFHSSKHSLANIYEKAFAFDQKNNANAGYSVTANLVSYRYVFNTTGHFNQGLMSGGDYEWNRRATEQGFTIRYCKESIVYHPARASMREIRKKAIRVAGGEIYRLQKLWFIRYLLPPVNTITHLRNNKNLTMHEKFIAFFVAYYLKLCKLKTTFLLKAGLAKPART